MFHTLRCAVSPPISCQQLSIFCGSLATCLSAGLNVPASLRACKRSASSATIRQVAGQAAELTALGTALWEALQPEQEVFPSFFLPVLRCGEQSGRLDEALRYLEKHCAQLAGPARLVRDAWLYPLVIFASGSIFKIAACAILAPFWTTVGYTARSLLDYAVVAAVAWVAFSVPQARRVVDRVKLALPVIGRVERELAINRFFHALNLVYSTGGMRVEAMIRLAAESVGNLVLRGDMLRAAVVIEAGGTIADAFAVPATIPADYRGILFAGDEAGKLEEAFGTVSRLSAEAMELPLRVFRQVFFRLVMVAVMLSTTFTIYGLILATRVARQGP